MENDVVVCGVRVINDMTNAPVYFGRKELNLAELNAINMSDKIYIDGRKLSIESKIFNYDDKTLEIHVNY